MSDDRNRQISDHAYRLWEKEGQPSDRALDHWVEAERQIGAAETSGPNEGEGNRTAARAYNRKTKAFAESGKVERQARQAKADLDGPEGDALREAEAVGRSHSHDGPPKAKSSSRR
jgi:Protein of unknown function (DUF2934)